MATNNGRAKGLPTHNRAVLVISLSIRDTNTLDTILAHLGPVPHLSCIVVVLDLMPADEAAFGGHVRSRITLPVSFVGSIAYLEPGQVYLARADHLLVAQDALLIATPVASTEPPNRLDRLLVSLIETGSSVSCLLLSGATHEGLVGARAVRLRGGIVGVVPPTEVQAAELPQAAIATNLADLVLGAATLPAALMHRWWATTPPAADDADPAEVADLLTFLLNQTAYDFRHYKRSTLVRRLHRRMSLLGLTQERDYLALLTTSPEAVAVLFHDMLISVTQFFRDPDVWHTLAAMMPTLFANKTGRDRVRVWVVGCATGEEAYSLAMLLHEYAAQRTDAPTVQVFATDVDEAALAYARRGSYPDTIAADIAPERLERFFTAEHQQYRVVSALREMVLFAQHNVLIDPPFSQLDMIACRNVLIYFTEETQQRMLQMYQYALIPAGHLLLGSAEATNTMSGMFIPVSGTHRLYRRQAGSAGGQRTFAPLPQSSRLLAGAASATSATARSFQQLSEQVLVGYVPPALIVNHQGQIAYVAGGAGRFLMRRDGEPSQQVIQEVLPALRSELLATLAAALRQRRPVTSRVVRVLVDDRPYQLMLTVQPLNEPEWAVGHMCIVFHQMPDAPAPVLPSAYAGTSTDDTSLQQAHDQFRITVDQYETIVEEYRAANDALQGTNDALRVTSQQLDISKEELQTLNEELIAVNQELKHRIQEVTQTSSDLHNLMLSTAIDTIFIDAALCVRRFTPSAQAVFNLIPGDINRPLAHITHSLRYATLLEDVQQVLIAQTPIERQVASDEQGWYLLRLQPYRTLAGAVDGVVLTLVDITRQKNAEEHIKRSREHLLLLFDSIVDYAIFTMDVRGCVDYWGTGAERLFGYTAEEATGMHLRVLMTPEDRANHVHDRELMIARDRGSASDDRWHIDKQGRRFFVSGKTMVLLNQGKISGYVKVARDLTEQHVAEKALQQSYDELERRVEERTSLLSQANDALRREVASHQKTDRERHQLLARIVTIQEQERRRIARELHDQLGQLVSALRMGLAALPGQVRAGQSLGGMVDALQQQAQKLDLQMDQLALELRPRVLDELGLASAIQYHVGTWSAATGIPAEVEIIGFDHTRLSDDIETTIYRIVQEALTNIVKHARASRVGVVLERRASFVRAIIEDNGRGFDQAQLYNGPDADLHLGLIGMHERAALVWGTLTIESTPGQGTTVFVMIPLTAPDDLLPRQG